MIHFIFFCQINFTGLFMIFNRLVMRYLQKHVFIYSLLNKIPGNYNPDITMAGAIFRIIRDPCFVVRCFCSTDSVGCLLTACDTSSGRDWN